MRILSAIALVFSLSSCQPTYTKSEIDEYLQPYFDGLNAGIYKPEGLRYSQSFGRKLESEEWKKAIDNTWQQFGSIEKANLILMSRHKSMVDKSSGTKYVVFYRIEREHGANTEVIDIFESNRSKGILEIISHVITIAVSF